ncbi:molybdopterin biosynthesis MoeB protein, partial [Candidatus Thiomargarita nelsonii]
MDDAQLLRYSRQILLPQVGIEGQERLLNAKVLIIGMGGLGSPAAMYLAAAGIGHLRLCDFDVVDLSNLQRQIIHNTNEIGKPKVESARETLLALNPLIEVTPLYQQLDDEALAEQVANVDVVLDCSDNLPTRFAINQACVNTKTPLVSGAAIRMEGQISVFRGYLPDSPCYRCLYPSDDSLVETCSQTGILAPLVGIIGSLQAFVHNHTYQCRASSRYGGY